MVDETKVVKKPVVSKKAAGAAKTSATPAKKPAAAKKPATKAAKVALPKVITIESAVWPFPAIEKAPKKAAAKKSPVAVKSAAPKKTTAKAPAKSVEKLAVAQPSAQERYRMVETAAYYIAERSNFQGNAVEHWAQAEIEIAAKLAG
jgi:hypothetical protein